MVSTNSLALSLLQRWLKARHNTRSTPSAASRLQLVAQPGQTRRGGLGSEEFPRLRLENHHAAGYAQLERTLTQSRQDSLVTTVNTVESCQ